MIVGIKVNPATANAEFRIKSLREMVGSEVFISNLFMAKLKRSVLNKVYGLLQNLYDLCFVAITF
ncbi:hypothetical protein OWR28_01760 [Chryseobacterium sp. 1B4]